MVLEVAVNDDEAEERADMIVMLLALVVVVLLLRVFVYTRRLWYIMRRKFSLDTTFLRPLLLVLINVRNNSKPDNLAVPFPIVSVFQLALFTVA